MADKEFKMTNRLSKTLPSIYDTIQADFHIFFPLFIHSRLCAYLIFVEKNFHFGILIITFKSNFRCFDETAVADEPHLMKPKQMINVE